MTAAPTRKLPTLLPGVALCLGVAVACGVVNLFLPVLSPLIVAIIAGIALTNTMKLPEPLGPGIDFSARKLLRAGIILLGLRLVLGDILALGAPMLVVVVCVVVGGLFGTVMLGRWLRVPPGLTLLVACGFSICGAAAVAGASGVIDPDDEREQDTVTAVALVVIFGTLMIPLAPLVASLAGLDVHTAGLWAGGAIHEIAQVVAVGGIIGGGALAVAVVVKLARVLLLAPIIAVLSLRQRRRGPVSGTVKPPPVVPPFVLGFLAMVALRSFVPIPEPVLGVGSFLQTLLLSAAMFGLGCGVRIRTLRRVGLRPFALAALSTLLVAGIAYVGVMVVR